MTRALPLLCLVLSLPALAEPREACISRVREARAACEATALEPYLIQTDDHSRLCAVFYTPKNRRPALTKRPAECPLKLSDTLATCNADALISLAECALLAP